MMRLLCVSHGTTVTTVVLLVAVALEYVRGSWVSGGRRGGPLWAAEAGLEVSELNIPWYICTCCRQTCR